MQYIIRNNKFNELRIIKSEHPIHFIMDIHEAFYPKQTSLLKYSKEFKNIVFNDPDKIEIKYTNFNIGIAYFKYLICFACEAYEAYKAYKSSTNSPSELIVPTPMPTIAVDNQITEPIIDTDEPIIDTAEPIIETAEPIIDTDEPIIETDEPIIDTDKTNIKPITELVIPFNYKLCLEQKIYAHNEGQNLSDDNLQAYNEGLDVLLSIRKPKLTPPYLSEYNNVIKLNDHLEDSTMVIFYYNTILDKTDITYIDSRYIEYMNNLNDIALHEIYIKNVFFLPNIYDINIFNTLLNVKTVKKLDTSTMIQTIFDIFTFLKPLDQSNKNKKLFEFIYSTYEITFTEHGIAYNKFIDDYILYNNVNLRYQNYQYTDMNIYRMLIFFGFKIKDNVILFLKKKNEIETEEPETKQSKRNANMQIRTDPPILRTNWFINNSTY